MVLFCIFASLHLIWFLFVADQRHAPEAALSRWELLMELMSIMWMHHLSSHPPTYSFLLVLPCVFHSLIHQGNRIPEVCNNWAYCRGAEIDEKCLRNILTHSSLSKTPPSLISLPHRAHGEDLHFSSTGALVIWMPVLKVTFILCNQISR